jgi:3-carboxy-cis,cis-muconate cycloisomerase
VRPPSSPSEGLFDGLFARGAVAEQVSDRAWLQAMLDVEAALARAAASVGLVPEAAAEAITARCDAGNFDLAELGREAATTGTPVPALVRALTEQLPDDAAAHVHRGATSQDILDTASMLVARRALGPLLEDLDGAAEAAARLAEANRGTLVAGRTLLQQALPTTFGLKAAAWLVGLEESRALLADVRGRTLAVQLGGAVGTLASLGEDGLDVASALARELELAEPTVPWHTVRVRPAVLAAALGTTAGVCAKIARDVILLAQTEVGEARPAAVGGSSTLPHKRNPVGAVLAVACAERTPGLVATMLAAMAQEHERGAGGWHAEWETLRDLLRLTGSAAVSLRETLEGLEVDAGRARENLDGLLMAESVATALTPALGRLAAHDLVERSVGHAIEGGRSLRDVLLETPEVARELGEDGLDAALDPQRYLGVAEALVDRALALRRA